MVLDVAAVAGCGVFGCGVRARMIAIAFDTKLPNHRNPEWIQLLAVTRPVAVVVDATCPPPHLQLQHPPPAAATAPSPSH